MILKYKNWNDNAQIDHIQFSSELRLKISINRLTFILYNAENIFHMK